MADHISGRPHPPLVQLNLQVGLRGAKKQKDEILVIDDASSVNYIDSHRFHTDRFLAKYLCGAYQPINAIFVFSDGSRYKAILKIPKKRGFLEVTYPINAWSFEELDDEKYVLDLEPDKTNNLSESLEKLGVYITNEASLRTRCADR